VLDSQECPGYEGSGGYMRRVKQGMANSETGILTWVWNIRPTVKRETVQKGQ